MTASPEAEPDTIAVRLMKLRRRERQTNLLGAALLGIITLVAGGVGGPKGQSPVLYSLLLTAILATVVCIARARAGFDWQKELIERELADGSEEEKTKKRKKVTSLSEKVHEYPRGPNNWYQAALLLIVLSGILLLLNVWWFWLGPKITAPTSAKLTASVVQIAGMLPPGTLPTLSIPVALLVEFTAVHYFVR